MKINHFSLRWCVDDSRNKYLLRDNNKWSVDKNGDKIFKSVYPKITDVYKIDNARDTGTIIKHSQLLMDLAKGQKRVINSLNGKSLLRNNI